VKEKENRRQVIILFGMMFIVMVGFGIIMPILPFYAESMGATATHLGLLFALYSILQFLLAPYWGRLSDRLGRRPVILIGLLGFALSFILFGLSNRLWELFAARALGGALSSAVLPTTMAYIADITTEEQRGSGMGMMGASMGLGMIFGPAIGGYAGEISMSLPFFIAAGIAVLIAVAGFFLLQESLTSAERERARHVQAEAQASGWADAWQALMSPIGFILLIGFLVSFAAANVEGTFALFAERSLGFGASEMGTIFVFMGAVMAVTQGLLVGPFINRWGEERMIELGMVASAIGYATLLVAWDMVSLTAIMAVMGIGQAAMRPAIASLLSKRSAPDQQGVMMGYVQSAQSLGRVVGPVVGGLFFDLLGYQSPYVFGSLSFVVILVFALRFFSRDSQRKPAPTFAWQPSEMCERE
jgi:multidrug resistance protein